MSSETCLAGRARAASAAVMVAALIVSMTACASDSSSHPVAQSDETVASTDVAALLGPEDVASGAPVKIGLLTEGSSATVAATDEVPAGQATVEWLNQHRGGIAGRPIELVVCEMKTDPAITSDCANKMVQEGVVAVTVSQTSYAEGLWRPLHDAGIPLLFTAASGDNLETDAQSTFIMANPAATFFGLPIAVAKSVGAKKVAFVVIDVPQAVDIIKKDNGATMGKAGLDYDIVPIPLGTADMVTQMQQIVSEGAGEVHILGNDAFCIAAIQGLKAVGYSGAISGVSFCFTDATRAALGSQLEGINIFASLAVGATGDPTYQLYLAVMAEYGQHVKSVDDPYSLSGYSAVATVAAALQNLQGDVTAATASEAIRTMPETELPGGGGVKIKCGGSAFPARPAICTNQWLRAELDASGEPTNYTVEDSTDVLAG